jgi:hypothetical protein
MTLLCGIKIPLLWRGIITPALRTILHTLHIRLFPKRESRIFNEKHRKRKGRCSPYGKQPPFLPNG